MGDAERPTGTVTFLFTDIQGSTALWESHRRAMTIALRRHDELLRTAILSHGGYVFSTAGDAFSASFWTPDVAVAAAVAAQRMLQTERWPEGAPIRVRMALHLGVADERQGDYFGPAVNRTARLMSLASGGQLLLSRPVEELVRDDLPDGVHLVRLGEYSLRGLSRPETVFQVTAADLISAFPPLASSAGGSGNLSLPSSSFVGRVEDVKRLTAALLEHRLVSLVGPGGVGKTRLALETAASLADRYGDGVWFIELAAVSDPDAVVHAVASSLPVQPPEGANLLESVAALMAGRHAMVVLDNCEHVIGTAAAVAAELGRRARNVTVLVTSRQRLNVPGEQVWPVNPLDAASDAVELFLERARAANPHFAVADDDLAAVAELCARLDGMPLAVELAAGRARSMTVTELAARLKDRFRLLRMPRASGADARQATLAATVEWSYRLLSVDEQLVFDRLSVFVGSFDAAAAGAVCADDRIDRLDVVDLLDELVDRSMVGADQSGGRSTRFSLLETMRQFGRLGLAERGELDTCQTAHLAHYRTIAQTAGAAYEGTAHKTGNELFEQEWSNLRGAVQHALSKGDLESLDDIFEAVQFFAMFTLRHECFEWALQATRWHGATTRCWGLAAWGASMDGRFDDCCRLAARGLELVHGEDPAGWGCWFGSAMGHFHSGHIEQAWDAVQGLTGAGAKPARHGIALGMAAFVAAAARPGEVDDLINSARREAQRTDSPAFGAFAHYLVCRAMFTLGRLEESAAATESVLALTRSSGNAIIESSSLMNLALCTAEDGSHTARQRWTATLQHLHRVQNWTNIWTALEALSCDWAERGHLDEASALTRHLNSHGARSPSLQQRRIRRDAILAQHPDVMLTSEQRAVLTQDEAVAFALQHLTATSGADASG